MKKKLSETVEVKEKGSRRRWKSKNFWELLINQVFEKKRSKKPSFFEKKLSETVEVKEKSSRRRWKAKKKALGDGESQRKRLSETVRVKEKGSRRRWKSKNFWELLINQVFERKGQKNQVFLKKKLSETEEVKEKSSRRR